MAVNLIRKNSDTPNIRNYDDARLFRYINQGKSGIIKDYGDELEITQGANNVVHIASGEIVHQGWQVEITSAGFDIQLEGRDTREYYTIYLEINLSIASQQKAEIKYLKGSESYPTIDTGDDLTTTPTGTSRLLIAQVLLQNNAITITPKLEVIPYYPTYSLEAEYASSDHSKGTIEQRLTDLGFKSGSCIISGSGYTSYSSYVNSLVKQGQMVRCELSLGIINSSTTFNMTISAPNDFTPTNQQRVTVEIVADIQLTVEATNIETTIVERLSFYNVRTFVDTYISSNGTVSLSYSAIKLLFDNDYNKVYGGVTTSIYSLSIKSVRLYTGWKLN